MGLYFETVRRMVSHMDFEADAVGEAFQVILEHITIGSVAAAAVAQQKHASRVGISGPAMHFPPEAETVAGELTGVVAEFQIQVAQIAFDVVEAVRIDHADRGAGKIVGQPISPPPRTGLLKDLLGILKTDAPPPNDEECRAILFAKRFAFGRNRCDERIFLEPGQRLFEACHPAVRRLGRTLENPSHDVIEILPCPSKDGDAVAHGLSGRLYLRRAWARKSRAGMPVLPACSRRGLP